MCRGGECGNDGAIAVLWVALFIPPGVMWILLAPWGPSELVRTNAFPPRATTAAVTVTVITFIYARQQTPDITQIA